MVNKLIRYSIGSDLIIYGFKCIIGFLIGYQLYLSFPQYELYWTMLSIILVISPEAKDARRLSIERFKSNLIGSGIGLFCYFIHAPNVYMLLLGIILSIATCYFFNLMNVARTAIVALIIVLIHEQTQMSWIGAVERFISVTTGCFIGLSITIITSAVINYWRKKSKPSARRIII
ncbi:FUSC family protein [Flavobacterium gawalongense]|uniref:FUSC family protein n=1 Tax=Flavobacterium gawalongense TaxID=2594432 RepID=UPI0011829DA0|nr:FUSC family protein [Flavobacterium gawalongense]TRX12289.1 FUSC family protein [Flavobacterium gawalongense]TRX30172.1 FUSC family protein [Flavobacterium gawalongense]